MKAVLIGDSAVGKSSVMTRFCDDKFTDSFQPTIGVDFKFKTLPVEGRSVKLQLWDTAGQERFRSMSNIYYKNADFVIFVFDLASELSFKNLQDEWIKEVMAYTRADHVPMLILGNKSDLPMRFASEQEIKARLAAMDPLRPLEQDLSGNKSEKFIRYAYQETSAKTGTNIISAIESLVKLSVKDKIASATSQGIEIQKISSKNSRSTKTCC